jgi:CRISPR system Cascade subunit CasC
MFIELHLIQNFAPSNLNRDDTGSPKDATFGGYRRLRISSQSLKRAIRTDMSAQATLRPDDLAVRTKRLQHALAERFQAAGKTEEDAAHAAEVTLTAAGFKATDEKTEYLLFLGQREIEQLAAVALERWDDLTRGGDDGEATKSKKQKAAEFPKELRSQLDAAFDGGRAADLALFGRMIADRPDRNIDAAAQVAHALSTHKVATEFDFYTAVDDLRPDDTEGADMLGTIEFASACMYRYLNLDLHQLVENLQSDEQLARTALEAFLHAAINAIPSGKQNSMAAHNPPSFVLVVARKRGLWSLANAFVNPVAASRDTDLIAASVSALDRYWRELTELYGTDTVTGLRFACQQHYDAPTLAAFTGEARAASVADVVGHAAEIASFA